MPVKRNPRQPPSTAKYMDAAQLCERYGGVSFMWIERRLETDPDFPRPLKFGRLRYFDIAQLEQWERKTAAASAA